MLRFFKRAALAGTLVASLLGSVLTAAPAMAASGTANLTFSPTTTSYAVGATFTVPANINVASGNTFGDQFGVNYDPAVLTLTAVDDGTFYSAYAATTTTCLSSHQQDWYPPSPAGTTQVGADILKNASASVTCATGASGTGTVATLHFTANAGVNAITTLSFTPVSGVGTQINNIATVTVNSLNLTIGTPPAPHLAVTGATTTAVSGTPTQFNVSYAVANTGTAPADNSTHSLTVTVMTGSTLLSTDTFTLPLAAGASTSTKTDGPYTLVGSLESITITADSAGTAGGPATGTTAYQYSAISATGNTTIAANLAAILAITAPSNVGSWTLTAGQTNNYPDGNLVVKSNVNYSVTVADANAANNGHFTEYNGTTFPAGGAQLLQAMGIQDGGGQSLITVSGTPQTYETGLASGQDPNFGVSYPTTFYQYVGFNDKPVKAPDYYYEVLVFAAAGSF